ncbi:NF-kappa-B inhibitor delta-like [Narcine bancroftii]|uniref:NF-kappa-B inhibitor delta-like n=1 Tax=Narcine bancroftii TaxID=1343680 RepID=UPI003832120F
MEKQSMTSKEKSQSNLPTVRELLEAKRRGSDGSEAVLRPPNDPQQEDVFSFPNSEASFGPVFPTHYPSWHTDVSQGLLSPEPPLIDMSADNLGNVNPVGVSVPCGPPAPDSLYLEQPAPYRPMLPGAEPLCFEPPQLPWTLSCGQGEVQPLLPPSPSLGLFPHTPTPLGGPALDRVRVRVGMMEVSELLEVDQDGDTILHIYVAKGMREFALAAADRIRGLGGLEIREHRGKTPLLVAVTANQPEIVSDLIILGADVHAADLKGQTALHLAASEGYSQILQAIQWTGVQVNVEARDYEGFTPLHSAVRSHNSSMRKQCEAERFHGEVCMDLQTLIQNKLDCIILLLNMGASIFTQDVKSSMSVLHHSVQEGNVLLVQLFLQLPNTRLQEFLNMKAHGNTALHMAAGLHGHRNQERIIRLLLNHGADPGLRNLEHEQPGHLVAAGPEGAQMKLMLRRSRPAPSANHRAGSS